MGTTKTSALLELLNAWADLDQPATITLTSGATFTGIWEPMHPGLLLAENADGKVTILDPSMIAAVQA